MEVGSSMEISLMAMCGRVWGGGGGGVEGGGVEGGVEGGGNLLPFGVTWYGSLV